LYVSHELSSNFNVFVRVSNLFDNTEYRTVAAYPMPGRRVSGGIKAEF